MSARLILQFDGSCEPNPGALACGAWIIWHQFESAVGVAPEKISEGWKAIHAEPGEKKTNNDAEWYALGFGLKELAETRPHDRLSVTGLDITGDSQLVIYQMAGIYACRNKRLERYRDRAKALLVEIGLPWTSLWIPRDQNQAADDLSRKAYEVTTGRPFPERERTR